MKAHLAVAAIALAVSACSPKAAGPAAAGETASGAAPVLAGGFEPEGPAPGKWKITVTSMGQTMPAQETCMLKQMTMAEGQEMQKQAGMTCSEQSWKKDGAATIGHSVCKMDMGGQTMNIVSDIRVTGDMKTAYTMESKSRMDPAPMPDMAETTTTINAERIGDC